MRAVIDTNVLVSGLMRYGTPPARIVDFLYLGRLRWLYDPRILGEYRDVLSRPKFKAVISPGEIDDLMIFLERTGVFVLVEGPLVQGLETDDPGDLPFMEVALAGAADVLVTGNAKHFGYLEGHVRVLSPADCLNLLC